MSCYLCGNEKEFISFNTIMPVQFEEGRKLIGINDVDICESCFLMGDNEIVRAILVKKLESNNSTGLRIVQPDELADLFFGT